MNNSYNPDVLSCIANLSNDEVFTPPLLANKVLDLLPLEVWSNKNLKFLDPVAKSGVFLREITRRLDKGLENVIKNREERIVHILHNQVYGIAITELTSLLTRRTLYCSKVANSQYSITDFKNSTSGNIKFENNQHAWVNGKCLFCKATEEEYQRDDSLESHAYEFIHTHKPEDIFKVKFDVIIGNPPYQLNDGGHGRSASPIYHAFVQQAKKMKPRYISMIIPARWYSGGKGLDDFRNEMLHDKSIRKLVDYENSSEVFPGVDIAGGVCYFLWDRDNQGDCEVTNFYKDKPEQSSRKLDEFDIFIRHSKALPIIRKVDSCNDNNGKKLRESISPRKPFSLPTNYEPKNSGIPCWYIQKIGLKFAKSSDVSDERNILNKWKLLIPPAPIAGQTDFSKPIGFYYDGNTRIAKPGECCTESWLVACAFDTKKEVESFKSYLFTKVVRFLLLQGVISQHVTRQTFCFVPDLGEYQGTYADADLIKKWGLSKTEWEFIDSRIASISGSSNE